MRVIAIAYGNEPLDRTTSGEGDGVVFIVNPAMNHSDNSSESGVGFPRWCVYEFNSELFDSLREVFGRGDAAALETLWSKAAPIGANTAA